jgi:hypothetical protein
MTAAGTSRVARTGEIRTAAELDALPVGAIVRGRSGMLSRGHGALGPTWYHYPSRDHAADSGIVAEVEGSMTVLFRPDAPQPATTDQVGWPSQIARAVAALRSEAASYEAVSRTGAESLYDDESDMPERMVDRLMEAGLIAQPWDDTKAVRVGIAVEAVIALGGIPDEKVQQIRVAIEEAMC